VTKPVTVNRELALLKTIFNRAISNGKAEHYPLKGMRMLKENKKGTGYLGEGGHSEPDDQTIG
jgi:hypothetical protein